MLYHVVRLGIKILFKEVHSSKASASIFFKFCGIFICFNEVQYLNEPSPIIWIDEGIDIVSNCVAFQNE